MLLEVAWRLQSVVGLVVSGAEGETVPSSFVRVSKPTAPGHVSGGAGEVAREVERRVDSPSLRSTEHWVNELLYYKAT